jgi:pimeloyl-ACP methyl ester carboxylesterase/2-polyprenyl-6-methoxyphenol hydroxylase-like FAD-dependent oxidoreductase
MSRTERRRAVVLGGSMAGLLATRMLADHFGEVVLVDRDVFPSNPDSRKGVPQARHVHVLLARGRTILERLFPGLLHDLETAGAISLDWPADALLAVPSGWASRTVRGVRITSLRRDLLEFAVRDRVLRMRAVRALEETDAVGLLAGTRTRVDGVAIRPRGQADVRELEADLVVDATGRGSPAPGWLEALGYPSPREETVNSFIGYASRLYEPNPKRDRDWLALFLQPQPPDGSRGAALFPVDGNRWHVTIAGVGRDYPPTDEMGFLDFARSLRSQVLYDAIRDARPVTPISGYRRTENRLRRFEELSEWPEGWLVIGDAVCSFNPIYGQGMTVAAEGALVLRRWLSNDGPGQAFQRELANRLTTPWLLATGADFRYPNTEGGRSRGLRTKLIHAYLDRLDATARNDDSVAHPFIRVLQMLAPPKVLFGPEVVARTLRGPRQPVDRVLGEPPANPRRPRAGETVEALDGVELRHRDFRLDHGIRLHGVEAGTGTLVVLLHGFPEFWFSWRRQIPALANAGYRAVAVDLRGYDLSDKPRGVSAYAMSELVQDVVELIQACGSASAVVAGHDWGGAIAWEVATRCPESVEALMIVNAPHPARFREALRSFDQIRRSWYIGVNQLPRIAEAWIRWGDYAFIRRLFRDGPKRVGAFTASDIERYLEAIDRPGALTAALNYYRGIPGALLEGGDPPRAVRSPVLVVWGDRDPFLGSALAEPGANVSPEVRVERIPSASHWPHLEEPDLVNAWMLDFLGRSVGRMSGEPLLVRDGVR